MRFCLMIALSLFLFSASSMAYAATEPASDGMAAEATESLSVKSLSGLPLPRFASLRSGEVNMRTGPGTRYPIEWVYNRKGLPVEITAEYDIWRRVRDPEGNEGWVHKNEISGKRTAITVGLATQIHELRDDADAAAAINAHVETGAIGQISRCARDWCKLKFSGSKGYMPKSDFWGAYPAETFD